MLANAGSPLVSAAKQLGVTPGQIALAWLLKKSPVILPIPGTSKVDHLESNTESALLHLDDHLMTQLNRLKS
jgi:aryl-alcohol dehydrogenase-like predicted oxidoreductase